METIRAEVTAISHTSLDRRVSEPRARDEVGRLARTMNEMLDRLQDASDRQRQFVSDASHELRSPVAAMRATGEVALAHPDATDWPIVVRRMLTEDDRMEQIVGDLLELARGEETELPDIAVDLDDVALEEVARARRSGIAIQSGAVSAGRVRGSREQLTRVVRNLLDNATRHATEHGPDRARHRPSVRTRSTNGPGTPATARPRDATRRSCSWWRTTARASRTTTGSGSSSASPASTRAAPATRAGSGWASRWCARSPSVTAAPPASPTRSIPRSPAPASW